MEDASPSHHHRATMLQALELAKQSPPTPSNFRVGAILVKLDSHGNSLATAATGYTLECPGNTHAEECCLVKLADQYSTSEEGLAQAIQHPHALYTTMEPCSKRLSGKMPCVDRVLRQRSWIRKVYVGVEEPQTFVSGNPGRQMLQQGGIDVHHVTGLEGEILGIATAGHVSG
ncbi:hypothetical protein CDD82_7611 [Ophiocordyceps australis]|uniref:CMP/dCMP-type deaminase domain-containing protein n=1 Tax=Ophiocordyceps australis TaxID=1399860 RepID=A0A2C5YRM8_9HYPO|nr:hypothetical protein CDD82_7611 [Ophiocordyceps australis]